MPETVLPEAVGRFEAEQEIPERMRAHVRLLGELLGRVLRESGSPGLYDDVERLRVATIQAYTDETGRAFSAAMAIADDLTVARSDEVARAFTAYFHLVNLAEEHQRIRVLRERDGRASRDPADSVGSAFAHLAGEVGAETALERLQSLRFHPVFTAHPTEARRRAVSSAIRRLADLLDDHDGASGATQVGRVERSMLEEIDTLWRTAPLRAEKPSPVDEVRSIMAVFDETLYTAIPAVYRRIDDLLLGEKSGVAAPLVRPFVRLGTWVGGDRDGNPFVTASVTKQAAAIASEHVLLGLERTAARVGRTLTLDATTTPPSAALLSLWQRLRSADEEAAAEVAKRSPDEPHRRVLLLLARRIAATRTRDADLAYRTPDDLLADLTVLQESLVRSGAPRQAYGHLQQLIWQAETFGFHLAELEVRQHSAVHAKVLAEIEAGGPLGEQ
ncbi:phosphoenolpyruvate carboxylase, partial [uncultured Amnibacterium sp.]|uniref:phosphoenolpyruvate carboxylase n=1 Tax=uncultured Amnibacterium sp. TaxID=1631851 RepID=UPI0035CC94D2